MFLIINQLFPVYNTSLTYNFDRDFHEFISVVSYRALLFFSVFSWSYHWRLNYFIDEFGADSLFFAKRLKVVSYLRNLFGLQIFTVQPVALFEARVQSIEPLYRGAGWAEREIFDIFGVLFYDHSDLRRILTDYGFAGFPLRKDYPVSGYLQTQYRELQRRLATEPVEFSRINPIYVHDSFFSDEV